MRSCLSVTPDPRTYASASSTRCLYSGRRAAVLSREGFVVLSCGLYALILSISPESATTIVPVAFNRSRVDAADIVDRGAGRNNARRSLTSEDRQTSQQQQNRLCGDISTEYRRRATGNGGAIASGISRSGKNVLRGQTAKKKWAVTWRHQKFTFLAPFVAGQRQRTGGTTSLADKALLW